MQKKSVPPVCDCYTCCKFESGYDTAWGWCYLQAFAEIITAIKTDPYLAAHVRYYVREVRVVVYTQVSWYAVFSFFSVHKYHARITDSS